MRDEIYGKVRRTFLEGIESIEGRSCRDGVEAAGLSRMHEHFPVGKILTFEHYLLKKLRNDLSYWTCKAAGMTSVSRARFTSIT